MKVGKLLLCVLLSLTLVVTFIPMMSFAQDVGDDMQETEAIVQPEKSSKSADVEESKDIKALEDADISVKDVDGYDVIKLGDVFTITGYAQYTFTPDQDGRYCFYSTYNGSLYNYHDVDPDGWVESEDVDSISDATVNNFSVVFDAEKGKTYYLFAEDYIDNGIAFQVGLTRGNYISSVNITIHPPVCGTTVSGIDWEEPNRQTPQPVVTFPSGANYELDVAEDWNYGIWYNGTGESVFEGPFKGDEVYGAQIVIRPKASAHAAFTDDCEIHITGGTLWFQDVVPGAADISIAEIKAVHNWKWEPTSPNGLLKNGTQHQRCAGCDITQNENTVLPGWANYYVKKMKVKKGKKSFTVKWKKQSKKNLKKFNGYQIRYSTKANMSGAKTVNAGKKAKSKKIKKLAKKTTYYVQMRSFTKTSAGTFYSKWSPTKKVKTK